MIGDLIFLGSSILIVFLSYWYLFMRNKQKTQIEQNEQSNQEDQIGNQPIQQNQQEQQNIDEEDEEVLNKSKKQLMKEAKKQAKKEEFEARQQQISGKQQKEDLRRKKQEEKDMERERIEQELFEQRQKQLEEERKREEEEYQKWKNKINIESEGLKQREFLNQDNMLEDFIKFIVRDKVVRLEDLGAEYGLTIQEVVQRINQLEETGRLSGVIDERGKYIYLTEQEMKKIAEFIKSRGSIRKLIKVEEKKSDCNLTIELDKQFKEFEKQMN